MSAKIFLIVLLGGVLLIPVAGTRVYPNIPLYPLDIICLALIGITAFSLLRKRLTVDITPSLVVAFGVLFLSSEISWLLAGASATGLGQLKSWLALPILAGLASAVFWQKQNWSPRLFLQLWLLGLSSLLVIAVGYLFFQPLTYDGRLQASFTSPNFLAFFLMPGVLLSYFFWEQATKQKTKLLFLILALTFLFVLFQTHSFSAWLALAGSGAWYVVQRLPRKSFFTVMLVVCLGTLVLLGAGLATHEKFSGMLEERSSLASRLTIWSVAIKALSDAPLFGIGIGRFQAVYLAYQPYFPPYLEWAVPQPHNLLLALWLQTGLAGLLAVAFLILQALRTKSASPEHLLLKALLVAMLIYGIFDTPLFGNALGFIWWAVLAFILLSNEASETRQIPRFRASDDNKR